MTASDLVRLIEGGKLCQGIFLSENLETVVQARERVIDVKDNVEFKDVTWGPEIVHHSFNSKIATKAFAENIEKHTPTAFSNAILFGVDIEAKYAERFGGEGQNYLSSVHYQLFPSESVHLGSNHIELRPEVINTLQNIEKSIERSAFAFKGHFGQFFEQYGSHITMGPIGFGGATTSIAFCKGFPEEDRAKLTAVATEASRAALQMESSNEIVPGLPFSAYEVLGQTSRLCAEDLQNITVVVNRIGGSEEETDLEKWKHTLNENSWAVIRRSFLPKPIWTLFPRYQRDFINHSKMASIMMEEWRSKKTTQISVKKRINEPYQETAESPIDQEWELLTDEKISESLHVSQVVDLKAEKVKGNWNEEIKGRHQEMTREDEMTYGREEDVDESSQVLKEGINQSDSAHTDKERIPKEESQTKQKNQAFQNDQESGTEHQQDEEMATHPKSVEFESKDGDPSKEIDGESSDDIQKQQSTLGKEKRQIHFQKTVAHFDADQTASDYEEEEASNKIKGNSIKKPSKGKSYNREEVKLQLRKNIQKWLKEFTHINRQNIEACLEGLVTLKEKDKLIAEIWEEEVIYLREVQKKILSMAKILKDTTDKKQKENIVSNLKTTLDWTEIQKPIPIEAIHFPRVRFVTEVIRVAENYSSAAPFEMEKISQLPLILKQELEKECLVPDRLQRRLEKTVKAHYYKSTKIAYECLLCVNVLQIFGYNMRTFLFECDLFVKDFHAMVQLLETHLKNFQTLYDIKDRQAYVFHLALMCLNDRGVALQDTIDKMPEELCPEAEKACFSHLYDENTIDVKELNTFSRKHMEGCKRKFDWKFDFDCKTLWFGVKNQLYFLQHPEPVQPVTNHFNNQSSDLNNPLQEILTALDMKKYYPQKLKYEDVLMISSYVYDDINKKPTSLQDLPRYFIKHIIGLDSDTRENCHITQEQDEEEDSDSGHRK